MSLFSFCCRLRCAWQLLLLNTADSVVASDVDRHAHHTRVHYGICHVLLVLARREMCGLAARFFQWRHHTRRHHHRTHTINRCIQQMWLHHVRTSWNRWRNSTGRQQRIISQQLQSLAQQRDVLARQLQETQIEHTRQQLRLRVSLMGRTLTERMKRVDATASALVRTMFSAWCGFVNDRKHARRVLDHKLRIVFMRSMETRKRVMLAVRGM